MDDIQPPSWQKILIIRFSSIGDIVLTTPVARAVKKQNPNASIHYLTKKGFEDIIANNPYIDKIHTFNGDLQCTVNTLKQEQFDFVIDLQHNLRSCRITSALKRPYKSFPKLNIQKWILVNFKLDFMPDKHIVERYFEAAAPLQITNDHKGLDFFISEKEEFDVMDLPAVFEDGYVAVSLAATYGTKRIPTRKLIEIGRLLYKPMLLLGGHDVIEQSEEIALELGEKVYNGCGKFTIHQSASIIRQSDCVLTGDTGLMHIAAALHKPIASLWGNTVPELGMYPYMPGERNLFRLFEVVGLSCRSCSKLGYKRCPLGHYKCMNNIPTIDVAEWINLF